MRAFSFAKFEDKHCIHHRYPDDVAAFMEKLDQLRDISSGTNADSYAAPTKASREAAKTTKPPPPPPLPPVGASESLNGSKKVSEFMKKLDKCLKEDPNNYKLTNTTAAAAVVPNEVDHATTFAVKTSTDSSLNNGGPGDNVSGSRNLMFDLPSAWTASTPNMSPSNNHFVAGKPPPPPTPQYLMAASVGIESTIAAANATNIATNMDRIAAIKAKSESLQVRVHSLVR